MDAICEKVGLTKGSVYYFFDSKGKQVPSASELADTLLGVLEGSIILAKAHREPARIPKALRGFRLSLATLVAEPV